MLFDGVEGRAAARRPGERRKVQHSDEELRHRERI
jgi:hypothetical protein